MGVVARGTLYEQFPAWARTRRNIAGLSPDVVANLLALADYSCHGQSRLFETIIAKDPDIRGAVQQRLLALKTGQWEFILTEDARKFSASQKRGEELISALKCKGWKRAIGYLGKYSLFGFAAVEVVFAADGSGRPEQLRAVPYNALDVKQGELYINIAPGWVKVDGDSSLESRLIILRSDDNDPAGDAVMRSVAGAFLIKFFAWQDWSVYSERLGDPPTKAVYKAGTVQPPPDGPYVGNIEGWLLNLLDELKAHSAIAVPEGVDISLIADARLDASKAFDLLIDRADRSAKRAILTSESTMQSGTEGQGARAADQVRAYYGLDTVIAADGDEIAEALQEQYVDRIAVMLGFEPGLVEVVCKWRKELPVDVQATVICNLKNAGLGFNEKKAVEELGFEYAPPKPKPVAPAPAPTNQPSNKEKPSKAASDQNAGVAGKPAAADATPIRVPGNAPDQATSSAGFPITSGVSFG